MRPGQPGRGLAVQQHLPRDGVQEPKQPSAPADLLDDAQVRSCVEGGQHGIGRMPGHRQQFCAIKYLADHGGELDDLLILRGKPAQPVLQRILDRLRGR